MSLLVLEVILSCAPDATAPPTPAPGRPASIEAYAGSDQAAEAGAPLPAAPAVVVRDAFGNGVEGITVVFHVTSGAGAVTGTTSRTTAAGVAVVDGWTIGAGENRMTARVHGADIEGNPVTFRAVGMPPSFGIDVRFLAAVSPSQEAAFSRAVARWRSIIVGDLPSVDVQLKPGDCGSGSPAMSERVDDLVIFVRLDSIDGPGGVLGAATPCRVRAETFLPLTGRMRFDTADLARLESDDALDDVILHELGHVLGFGTIWSMRGLLIDASASATEAPDTHFNGVNTLAAFDALGGASYAGAKVPVENTGGVATRDSHWRESVLANELMTGFLSEGMNPLSLLTIRSLEDVGYVVDPGAADALLFRGPGILPDPAPTVQLLDDILPHPIRVGGR